MLDSASSSFYEEKTEQEIIYHVVHLSPHHTQISSYPLYFDIPSSEISISSLYISKDNILADYYHVNWVCDDKLIVQVFSSESGRYEDDEYYRLTFRYYPNTLRIPNMKTRDVFKNQPVVIGYRKDIGAPLPEPNKYKITFRFKKIPTLLDKVLSKIGFLGSIINIIDGNFI